MNDFEQQIVNAVRDAIPEAITRKIASAYHGDPINVALSQVIEAHVPKMKEIVSQALTDALDNKAFVKGIKEAFNHKLARILVSKFEGEIEKRVGDLRADPIVRAKITLAIEQAISQP